MTTTEPERITLARKAYDGISSQYEGATGEQAEHNRKVLTKVLGLLPPNAKVLDVGCGTGKPVAAFFADHGHSVTGMDFSDAMLERARAQVPSGEFFKAEMTTFVPPSAGEYDLIIASYSLYNLSVFQIRMMVYKFAEWLKKGGILAIGSAYRPERFQTMKVDRHGWLEGFTDIFMGHKQIDVTIAQAETWVELLKETGMQVLGVDKAVCMLKFGDVQFEEHHFYALASRQDENPLHGPFPIPKEDEHVQHTLSTHRSSWEECVGRMIKRGDVEAIASVLKSSGYKKVLAIGDGAHQLPELLRGASIEIAEVLELRSTDTKREHLDSLPYPAGHFDAVVLVYAMHHGFTGDPKVILQEALRVLDNSPGAAIIVDQGAPDNELIALAKRVAEDIGRSDDVHYQHGVYLHRAEELLREAGFGSFSYDTADIIMDFSDLPSDERIPHAAAAISGMWFPDEVRKEAEERFKEILKIQFLYRPGQVYPRSAIMIARR